MSDDLVKWLGEQLDEDEGTAKAVQWDGSGNRLSWELAASATVDVGEDEFYAGDRTIANHIVTHDPASVLREIDAKRRVLARHHAAPIPPGNEWAEEYPYCAAHAYTQADGTVVYPVQLQNCPELRDLAAPYADRPGYREEWRP
ncbi:DUF6221 family protein [Streptomyces sp. NPDC005863]|uniref:DUF6221 family protein n=1 Tax=Streptomyces sp. NPDC005863 TaxID=3364735 RepID=UPI0036792D73